MFPDILMELPCLKKTVGLIRFVTRLNFYKVNWRMIQIHKDLGFQKLIARLGEVEEHLVLLRHFEESMTLEAVIYVDLRSLYIRPGCLEL